MDHEVPTRALSGNRSKRCPSGRRRSLAPGCAVKAAPRRQRNRKRCDNERALRCFPPCTPRHCKTYLHSYRSVGLERLDGIHSAADFFFVGVNFGAPRAPESAAHSPQLSHTGCESAPPHSVEVGRIYHGFRTARYGNRCWGEAGGRGRVLCMFRPTFWSWTLSQQKRRACLEDMRRSWTLQDSVGNTS